MSAPSWGFFFIFFFQAAWQTSPPLTLASAEGRAEQWQDCLAPSVSHNASRSIQPTAGGRVEGSLHVGLVRHTHSSVLRRGLVDGGGEKYEKSQGKGSFLNGGGALRCEGVNIRILWATILGGKLLFRLSAGGGTVRSCKVVLLCRVLNRSSGRNSSPQLASPHSAALLSKQLLDSNHSGIWTCRQGSTRSPICLCVCISCFYFLRALLKGFSCNGTFTTNWTTHYVCKVSEAMSTHSCNFCSYLRSTLCASCVEEVEYM